MEPNLGNSPVKALERPMECPGGSDEGNLKLSDVIMVPIGSLLPSDSPRSTGEDAEHIRTLAESEAELPPIVVMSSTKRVIDGMHRLRATELRGATEIAVRYFEGEEKEAFVFAVKSNITHGLPLSLDDRKAAATRVLDSHPLWSDRAIGLATGLSAKTVRTLRSCSTAGHPQSNVRIGRDGRARPLDPTEGRKLAGRLIQENPSASLRQIAAQAGVSLSTASDVRKRLRHGESPLPERGREQGQPMAAQQSRVRADRAEVNGPSRAMMLRHLSRDPSVRLTEDGRVLLRWLNVVAVRSQEWDRLLGNVPPHRVQVIAELARGCAEIWQRVAEQLGQADADEMDGQALHDADKPPHHAALRSGLRRAVDVPAARPDERTLHELGKAARPW
ncbi:ParB N-terminal domain-containing protein [Streptomyces sp. SID8375]|uniref:Streptomycin biosynthesis operon regulator n=2 Tax=Streptomyces TaxID=1883 RepID=D3Y168_STRPT|nr:MULTISPECIES: ParB/RepB/Spo0J family partition protein [Streptomyces]ADC52832.1 streptomycin biosynthesis operon regulator [Streptomyces platensis]MYX08308.1 ParB N-terminal domain-containing protein [Streptomyces sp. SID8375]WAU02309.1 ParB/RepB/Spo0J family partition protein [Streptomyces nigrescens]